MKPSMSGSLTEQKMFRMGYLKSSDRAGCHNCILSEDVISMPDTDYERTYLRCKRGEFATTKTAICNDWKAK